MMAAVSLVGLSVWSCPYSSASTGFRFPAAARRSSLIICSNGPEGNSSGRDNPIDWDEAWQKLKVEKQQLENASSKEMAIAKVERQQSDLKDKDMKVQRGQDVGPRFTKWGGSVRGGKYQLGEGADRILEFWGNGDAALYAAMAIIILIFVLLAFRPAGTM